MVRSTLRILSNNLVRKSIAKAVSDHPDIHEVEIGAVIKRVKSRQVVECYINGERMVAKRFSTGDPAGIVNSLVAELAKVSRNMSSGLNKVNICRFAIPEKGLVVLNFAEGSRFDDHIARALPASRQQLMLRAGEWLAAYVNFRQQLTEFLSRRLQPMVTIRASIFTFAGRFLQGSIFRKQHIHFLLGISLGFLSGHNSTFPKKTFGMGYRAQIDALSCPVG